MLGALKIYKYIIVQGLFPMIQLIGMILFEKHLVHHAFSHI